MKSAVVFYKALVDGLVSATWRDSIIARRIREWGVVRDSSYRNDATFNTTMAQFTAEQRATVAALVQEAHQTGMFQVLAYLTDEINLDGLRLTRHGVELPVEPFGMTLYEDWQGRCDGKHRWPDEK